MKMSDWRWIAVIAAVAVAVALVVHLARPRTQVGGPASEGARVSLDDVDHTAFDALLQKHVDGAGLVAYRKWKASDAERQALDGYLVALGRVDLERPASRDARLAFWINAYNALTIKGILDVYPTTTIRNHTSYFGGYNLWTDLLLWVDGQKLSLDKIEHEVLRPLGEPRVHFALVCAARGCPPLRNRAWTADTLNEQLADNARRYFARPENLRLDSAGRTVHLSQLFEWYGADFASTPLEQVKLLRPYFPSPEKLGWLSEPDLKVKYLDYDWALNDQEPAER